MGTSLYVGNIPWEVTEDELTQIFRSVSQVDEIRAKIERDQLTGQSRGFGFVEVPDDRIEDIIISMHGFELGGRELIVN